mgnify:CR=1 FL=1
MINGCAVNSKERFLYSRLCCETDTHGNGRCYIWRALTMLLLGIAWKGGYSTIVARIAWFLR